MDIIFELFENPWVVRWLIALFVWMSIGWVFLIIGWRRQGAPSEYSVFFFMSFCWPWYVKECFDYHRWEK